MPGRSIRTAPIANESCGGCHHDAAGTISIPSLAHSPCALSASALAMPASAMLTPWFPLSIRKVAEPQCSKPRRTSVAKSRFALTVNAADGSAENRDAGGFSQMNDAAGGGRRRKPSAVVDV